LPFEVIHALEHGLGLEQPGKKLSQKVPHKNEATQNIVFHISKAGAGMAIALHQGRANS